MATSKQIEQQLSSQEADYLKRLEGAGQLPTAISSAWDQAGGAETANLRTKEGDLLKNYISAGAANREKYKDVWDPFARDSLASKQTALDYSPIADIRSELAMRAQALGVATTAATSMYDAGTKQAETAIGFTKDAYTRAYQREHAGGSGTKLTSPANLSAIDKIISEIPSDNPANPKDKYISRHEAAQALERIKATYSIDENKALELLNKALDAGGWTQWESLTPAQQQEILTQQELYK